jgi:hypothetical protein
MRRPFLQIVLFTSIMLLSTICQAQSTPAPQISSVSPATARAGDQVILTGSAFGASQGSGNVWLGSTYGVVVSWSDTQVIAAVASGAQSGIAQILQSGVWSNAVNFTVITPNITTVSPTTAIAGTQVTITGAGFGATQGVALRRGFWTTSSCRCREPKRGSSMRFFRIALPYV